MRVPYYSELAIHEVSLIDSPDQPTKTTDGVQRYELNDEIVGYGHFHIERMDDGLIWLNLAGRAFFIGAKGRGHVTLWDEDDGKEETERRCKDD